MELARAYPVESGSYSPAVTVLTSTSKYLLVANVAAGVHLINLETHETKFIEIGADLWSLLLLENTLYVGRKSGDLETYDPISGSQGPTMHGHTSTIRNITQYGPDHLITCSRDTTLKIWNIRSRNLIHTLTGHTATVRYVEILKHRPAAAVSLSYDGTSRLWDLDTGTCLRVLTGHTEPLYTLALGPTGTKLVTGSGDRTARIWDLETGSSSVLQKSNCLIAWTKTFGDTLVTADSGGKMWVWDWRTLELRCSLQAHHEGPVSGILDLGEGRLFTTGGDGWSKLWRVGDGEPAWVEETPTELIWQATRLEDGRVGLVCMREGKVDVKVYQLKEG